MRYQSTTGLDSVQVTELVARVFQVLSGRGGVAGNWRLGLFRQVELVLFLARQNVSQMVAGDVFGVSQPTVSRIWRRLVPVIGQVLCLSGISLAEAVQGGRLVLVDGTYVPTGNRPGHGREVEKANYSGKRGCQCLSIQVAADRHGGLLAVSDPVPGARHDAAAIELTGWAPILQDTNWIADTAYTATNAITPVKKPRHRDRHESEKEFNRQVASLRAPVERAIAHVKNWKILATGYRGRLHELPAIIHLITKLELYRLGW
jgi:hypothetical protein